MEKHARYARYLNVTFPNMKENIGTNCTVNMTGTFLICYFIQKKYNDIQELLKIKKIKYKM